MRTLSLGSSGFRFKIFFGFLMASTPIAVRASLPAQFAVGPDDHLNLALERIQDARRSLVINLYQFQHPQILKQLVAAMDRGVRLELLIEAEPVRGMTRAGWETLRSLKIAMRRTARNLNHRLILMRKTGQTQRRYRWNHAKYLVADGEWVWVSSENWTQTGHAESGQVGNRGWSTSVRSAELASQLLTVFRYDTDPRFGDTEEPSFLQIPRNARPETPQSNNNRDTHEYTRVNAEAANPGWIQSPGALMGLTQWIRATRDRLDSQQMSMPYQWRKPEMRINPLVAEWIALARQKKTVRLILNDDRVFEEPSEDETTGSVRPTNPRRKNWETARALAYFERCERIPIRAKIISTTSSQVTYVHNKGMIRDGRSVLVSSINGTQNSIENNREIALSLDSSGGARYFGQVFDWDWNHALAADALEPLQLDCSGLAQSSQPQNILFENYFFKEIPRSWMPVQ